MRSTNLLAACIGLGLGLTPALPVRAEGNEGAETGRAAEPTALTTTITVTAEKREDDLHDVSQSVDVLEREEIDALSAAGQDILFLSGRSPSLVAESSSGRVLPRFYIRGLGNTDFDLNANQPVSLVYDDVVLENASLKGFPVFDLERIEVLRGPQGTLFGRNTTAGTIKFESAKPTRERESYFRAYGGRFETADIEGAVSGPLSETLSGRLSGLVQRRSDFVDNLFYPSGGEEGFEEYREYAGRAQLLYEPGSKLRALFSVKARSLDGGSRVFRANVIERGSGGLVDGFDRFSTAQDATQILELDVFGASAKIDWDLGSGTLTSVTAYETVRLDARGDVDGGFGADFAPPSGPGSIPFAAETADNITGHDQITQELRFAFPSSDRFETLVGAFFFYENLELENLSYDTLAGGTVNGLAVQDQTTRSFAVFGSTRWQATERFSVQGGLRWTAEDKQFTAERLIGPFGSGTLGPLTEEPGDNVLTGDLTLRWDFDPRYGIYGRYARGFRAPNVQGRIVFGDAVTVADTETVDSLEIGAKTVSWAGRAVVNTAAFYYETDQQQLTAVGGAGNFNQLLNADSVVGYGGEVDVWLRPLRRLRIGLGASLNETEIRDPDLEVAVCAAPCTVLDPINPQTGNALIDGNRLPQAPRWITNLTLRYGVPLRGGGEWYVHTDWAYRDRVSFFLYESVEFADERLSEVGLRLGYAAPDGRWEVAAVGRNIFDDTSLGGGIDFNNLSGFVNEPPVWGIEVVGRF